MGAVKMKLRKKIVFALFAVVMLITVSIPVHATDDDSLIRNRYNVVFVTDESGSMGNTDPNGLRYEAIKRFVALMAQQGNCAGSVNFGTDIVGSQEVTPISGLQEKEKFVNELVVDSASGWTNIGGGLMEAVNLLNRGANQENPSVIILLTDGNTDMATDKEKQESLNRKAEAIEMARQAGYQIYTISLNVDGTADNTELQQIAKATGGEFQEVRKAEDLEDIQTMYYKMIFGAVEGDDSEDITINSEGYAEKEFEVPGIGVEEFNVLLEGKVSNYSLTNPEGFTYSSEELEKITMKGQDFAVIKVENPVGGTWKVVAYGDPGIQVNFRLLYNSDFYLTSSISPEGEYRLNQKVIFRLIVCDRNGPIVDPERYVGFSAQLHLTINGEEKTYDMELGNGGFTYDVELTEQGTYHAYMTATNGDYSSTSDEKYEINIENSAPVASGETLAGHANIWPFVGGSATIDLENAVSDPDGDAVTYTVESTAFLPEDYSLNGTKLTINNFSIPKGSFTIRATDPYGAYCTVEATATSTNIGLVMAVLIVVGALVGLIAVALVARFLTSIPFMGTISVEKYDCEDSSYAMPATLTPGRGRVRVESFGFGTCGLPAGSYFQAGGKDKHIYFISKKPVYSDAVAGPSKKIPIDGNGLEVLVCVDQNMGKGIRVTFQSVLYNQFDF